MNSLLSVSQRMYDAFAPHYHEYAHAKSPYLAAVDAIILRTIKSSPHKPNHVLDVGPGDGKRIDALRKKASFEHLTVIESSKGMADLCRKFPNTTVIHGDIVTADLPDNSFDYITCLWNVLGHIADAKDRQKAISTMALLLKPGGLIFFDVNNRYNFVQYGSKAPANMLKDCARNNNSSGDITFKVHVKDSVDIDAEVHLFSPWEIQQDIHHSGLDIVKKYCINYSSGKIVPTFLQGQLMYILTKHG